MLITAGNFRRQYRPGISGWDVSGPGCNQANLCCRYINRDRPRARAAALAAPEIEQ
jgi:hypothetical protein